VAAGGGVIAFNCLKSPFVQAGLVVSLFDVQRARVTATVDKSGMAFALDFNVKNIEGFTLACTLKDSRFGANAEIHFGVDTWVGPLHVRGVDCGRLHVTTKVIGKLKVSLDSSRFRLTVDGWFEFEGLRSGASLDLDAAPRSLAELPPRIVKSISDKAQDIFAPLFADGARWAGMVKLGVVKGAGDVATTLRDAYRLRADEAADAMRRAGYGANEIMAGMQGAYRDASGVLDSAVRGVESTATTAGRTVSGAVDGAVKGAESTASSAGRTVENVGREAVDTAKKIGSKLDPTNW
jgi:hypothetical protein